MSDGVFRARRGGKQFSLTKQQYDALPEAEKDQTELQIDGVWQRPSRLQSDGSDLEFS
jgi:hypothetical protein